MNENYQPDNQKVSPHLVLVIDDDPNLRRIVELCLARFGEFVFCFAENGWQGVQLADTGLPELILLDFDMPGMDGLDTLRHLRASKQTETMPVIAITGALRLSERCSEMVAGCNDYLFKPFDLDRLGRLVQNYLPQAGPA
ncbi:MAG: response regulator [Chloroflexi bacterium]|nr:response regulator [Chloroflexota bacterium]